MADWLAARRKAGNHSWDHPCLDRCGDSEHRHQVRLAHEGLSEVVGAAVDVFAQPSGDSSPAALDELRSLGYRLVAECDHRLVARHADPTAVSRLRLDASVDLTRTRAVVSGAHSAVFHAQQRVRGMQGNDAVT